MSIHFYRDDAGYVGESRRYSGAAEDVQDAARDVSARLSNMLRLVEDLIDAADATSEAVDEDPSAQTHTDAAAWRAIAAQMDATDAAIAKLSKMMRGAA